VSEQLSARDAGALGRTARERSPRGSHAEWVRDEGCDPVAVVTAADDDRLAWLLPARHARMAESSFAFHQAAAGLMAGDLQSTPVSGLEVQLCGDAHVANFGAYTSTDGGLQFGVDDLRQTRRGPWEWDVKRLAASAMLAARHNGYPAHGAEVTRRALVGYRRAIATFAEMTALDGWYASLTPEQVARAQPSPSTQHERAKIQRKAHTRISQRALGAVVEAVEGGVRLRAQPHLLTPLAQLGEHVDVDALSLLVERALAAYGESLGIDGRQLLARYRLVDAGVLSVGVAGVADGVLVVLLSGYAHGEPLLLQATPVAGRRQAATGDGDAGGRDLQRVVAGERLIGVGPDVLLGWSPPVDELPSMVWRLFRATAPVAAVVAMDPDQLAVHAHRCGWTLAHAHARTGDAAAIAGYLGRGRPFERSLLAFADSHADQTERDADVFKRAIKQGRVDTARG
jgi:hypothetical protein